MSRALIVRISDAMDCSLKDADAMLKAVLQCARDEVAQNGKLSLKGFGVFSVDHLKRTSKLNGTVYNIDQNYVRFKAGKQFNQSVRQG